MSWHYIAGLRSIQTENFAEAVWNVYEVYDLQGRTGWTAEESVPQGDTREELIADLRRMLTDLERGDEHLNLDEEKVVKR